MLWGVFRAFAVCLAVARSGVVGWDAEYGAVLRGFLPDSGLCGVGII